MRDTISSQLTAVNTTFSGNSVSGGFGAAITLEPAASVTAAGILTNCTIVSNTVSGAGQPGAIYLQPGGTTSLSLYNTIVSGNKSGGAPGDITGAANAGSSYTLIGPGGGLANGVIGSVVGVSHPLVAPLGNCGGPTQTMPPAGGSPAR